MEGQGRLWLPWWGGWSLCSKEGWAPGEPICPPQASEWLVKMVLMRPGPAVTITIKGEGAG